MPASLVRADRTHAALPLAVGLAYLFGAIIGLAATRDTNGLAALWPSNAILITVLLLRPPAPARIIAWCACASFAANLWFGLPAIPSLLHTAANVTEVIVASLVARKLGLGPTAFDRPAEVVRFSIVALSAATVGATVVALTEPAVTIAIWWAWFLSDLLGILVIAPLGLMVAWTRREDAGLVTARPLETAGLLLSVAIVAGGVFSQSRFPMLFLPVVPMMAVTYRLGSLGTGAGLILVAAIGTMCTLSGIGPVALVKGSVAVHVHFLQFYLTTLFAVCLPMAAALAHRALLAATVRASEARHRRIVERSRTVIFEADAVGRWTFLNPAWTLLTGHDAGASIGESTIALVDTDDRSTLIEAFEALLGGADEAMREVRYRDTAGRTRWVQAMLFPMTDDSGAVIGLHGTLDDVTEARAARIAIAESERRYRLLADNATDLILRIDLHGRLRYVSPAAERLLGVTPEAMMDGALLDGVDEHDRVRLRQANAALLAGAPDQICTYQFRRTDGGMLWLEAAIRLSRDAAGQPIEFHATVRDVTRRKDAEAETEEALTRLQESHRLLSLAGSVAKVGYWSFDITTGVGFWSDEVCKMHGVEAAPSISRAIEFYHPEDRAMVESLVGHAMAEGEDYSFSARLVLEDGSIRHVLSSGTAELSASGHTVGLFGVIQDVTDRVNAEAELRSSEERFRAITEQAGDMITLHDTDGDALFVSPTAAAILGRDPLLAVGPSALRWVVREDRKTIAAIRGRLLAAAPGVSTSSRVRMTRDDGSLAWVEVRARLAEIGGEARIVAVWRDISAQVEREAELRAARADAEAALRAKAEFLANMSHEIRTPMNGVIGFTELLLGSPLDEDQRHHAQLIADSGKAMMTLLNDILDLSKIDAGQLAVVAEPFALPHTLRGSAKLLAPAAERKGLTLKLDLADDLPEFVRGDPFRLRQVVLNLIGNAIKFTGAGGVTVSAHRMGDRFLVKVADTGIGIPADRQVAIFEQFVQADHSITRRYGGSGLGLAISTRLATLMGGSLALDSAPGLGTTVTLDLPLVEVDPAEWQPSVAPAAPRAPPARPLDILLADDHDINQVLVTAMLARAGHSVTIAADGAEALKRVQAGFTDGRPFDLVLMDMQMPVMDGLTATRAIRALGGRGATLPIVALTANAFASDLEACRAAGMNDHLAKPISAETLLAAVERWAAAAAPVRKPFVPGAALTAKYDGQKTETLAALDALVREGAFTGAALQDVADRLHKLAGTAAMFGEAALGEQAKRLEHDLRRWDGGARDDAIEAAIAAVRAAA